MTTPTEHDVTVVQDKLAELYATLAPAQREVLDTILAAGMSMVTEDDTSGFVLVNSSFELEQHMQYRMTTLKEEWRQANATGEGDATETRTRRWNFKPLLEWASRAQPRTA
jgi:hypothetical protein